MSAVTVTFFQATFDQTTFVNMRNILTVIANLKYPFEIRISGKNQIIGLDLVISILTELNSKFLDSVLF